ncbi:hypothetical protein [Dyadobacter tibetensis]|uniref:hypothetical protein n=1 Tax=Dyadobacter tibetensis TaxID=1211851 RepID=UPI0004706BB2|nr:hypothetical protein [Dyadobacter tibetensis]
MQIKLYLLLFISLSTAQVWAQEMFPKKELYHVWILAGEDLDKGNFDEAAMLYSTHSEIPSFKIKLQQIAYLKKLRSEAERLQKKGNYAEAVDKYKEYRKLKDIGSIGIFEKKISDCLTLINQRKLGELTSQQRVITGFEWAHRGRQKLSQMDTIAARKDFNNARILGGSRNNILKEQYQEGLRQVEALTKWGKLKAVSDIASAPLEEQLSFLRSYREIRNIDLPSVELKIKQLEAELEGNNSIKKIAKLCDTDLLLTHVQNHAGRIENAQELSKKLQQYKSTVQKINQLKLNTVHAATVESAYSSLLTWIADFPEDIRDDLTACILKDRFQTFENYSEMAQINSDKKSAEKFKKLAQQSIPSNRLGESERVCEGLADFHAALLLIRRDLQDCQAANALLKWSKGEEYLENCPQKDEILEKNRSLKDSIDSRVADEKLINEYFQEASTLIARGACASAIDIYIKMKGLQACNQDKIDEKITQGMLQANGCKKNAWWKIEITGGLAGSMPKYKLDGKTLQMGNGQETSFGAQVSYIDHQNPVDFTLGLAYFHCQYYAMGSLGSVLEDYRLSGLNTIFAIKLHLPNTNPNKLRPYVKLGTEFIIPTDYGYESFSTFKKVEGTSQIQKTILSVTGAVGIEIQKKNFGASLEGFTNFMMANSIYNSSIDHIITAPHQPLEATVTKLGVRASLRFW